MNYKYLPKSRRSGLHPQGRPLDPHAWITGPDPLRREKYYAYLKHRSQCKFRGESYDLEFEDWERLWSDDDFLNRGRQPDNLCLVRRDRDLPWSFENCDVITRMKFLQRSR